MRRMRFAIALMFGAALVLSVAFTTPSDAAPYRKIPTLTNNDPEGQDVPVSQWFTTHVIPPWRCTREFYDNVKPQHMVPPQIGFPAWPWGGDACTDAVTCYTQSVMRNNAEEIIGFTVRIKVTNDLYDFTGELINTPSSNSHHQTAPSILNQTAENMIDVWVTTEWASYDPSPMIPGGTPPQVNHPIGPIPDFLQMAGGDAGAWYCYCDGEWPITGPNCSGKYAVSAWHLTDSAAVCSGGTQYAIQPGETHYKDVTFTCIPPVPHDDAVDPIHHLEDWIVFGGDKLACRSDSLKISDFPSLWWDDVCPSAGGTTVWGSTGSVFYNPANLQPGALSFTRLGPADHVWWPTSDSYNEMLCMRVEATGEQIWWKALTLTPPVGDLAWKDVQEVSVWLDVDGDCKVSEAVDVRIGFGTYAPPLPLPVPLKIALRHPIGQDIYIGAGEHKDVIVAYKMGPTAGFCDKLQFNVSAITAIGLDSGCDETGHPPLWPGKITVTGLPMSSALKLVGSSPVKIGDMKKGAAPPQVTLVGEVVSADFTSRPGLGYIYVQEADRTAGVAVTVPTGTVVAVGDVVSITGTLSSPLVPELNLNACGIIASGTKTLRPLGMNSKATGGGAMGLQIGVMDVADTASPVPAVGLNNVGLLVRTWGTCRQGPPVPGFPGPAFWLDDGSDLLDGFTTGASFGGIACLVPPAAPLPGAPYVGATGILKCIMNPLGMPVRLLVPRTADDITGFAP